MSSVTNLTTPANRVRTKPGDFHAAGDTDFGGIYEINKSDGGKVLVSRQYSGIEVIDCALQRFCKEVPKW